ncbi:MAG TPA: prepilin-type N-terminal cleavage/methylation domain-containing protein [Longimicrobium sp.]|jgi:prepilin-type N-terminal cleavage/methylation domain-containing protein
MRRHLRNSKGFTLIELMIVVVIIGILAALAIPRFTQASARAKEKEADGILKQVYTLENAYYANNGAWASTNDQLKTVGWDENTTAGLKNYSPPTLGAPPYTMNATGSGYCNRTIDANGSITSSGTC